MIKKSLRRSYARPEARREPYDYVLIVCEGTKSEPNYFKAQINKLHLRTAKISSEGSSDPVNMIKFAKKELEKHGYDRVFCVFDHDGREVAYKKAQSMIRDCNKNRAAKIMAISSWPCFEFWYLLHYTNSTAPFNRTGKKSTCDNVGKLLYTHYPAYKKGSEKTFDELWPMQEQAIKHAKRLKEHNEVAKTDNPSTNVHELVLYLQNIKHKPKRT